MFSLNGLSDSEEKIGKVRQSEGDAVECVSPSFPPYTLIYMFICSIYTFSYL